MGEILLLVFVAGICYFLGRASMLKNIIQAVAEEAGTGTEKQVDNEPGKLFVEKINDVYYAYVGQKFAGQSADLNELFSNMKNIYKIETFKITHIEGISKEEGTRIAEAIAKIYNVK